MRQQALLLSMLVVLPFILCSGFRSELFIPTLERINENLAMNIPDLMQHFKYRKDKLKLLREVEVIIVDEVSMLRADVLI